MPVLLVTMHAYRSWPEGDPRGYVRHGLGLQPTNEKIQNWRAGHAGQPPNRFGRAEQKLIHGLLPEIGEDQEVELFAVSVTPTHVHAVVSFVSPMCDCSAGPRVDTRGSAKKHHDKSCAAWKKGHDFAVKAKRVIGGRLSKATQQPGRKWFSRGEDISPVWDRQHLRYLLTRYLPKHEGEGGLVKVYRTPPAD